MLETWIVAVALFRGDILYSSSAYMTAFTNRTDCELVAGELQAQRSKGAWHIEATCRPQSSVPTR
jgi:hypothetical protein